MKNVSSQLDSSAPAPRLLEGQVDGRRLSSRELEEAIQAAVKSGARELAIEARGQHGIGGRIWPKDAPVRIRVRGPVGQRLGAMGMFGTEIVVEGGVSDDVGWLNCGSRITVLGDVTDGAHNAGAQGILYVQGGGGARCDTMTKQNPRFEPLQSWYFRDVGDSFAEFKAGGIAVICGVDPRHPDNILGHRPCVGMVGGTIYCRGPVRDHSAKDVQLLELTGQDWEWLSANLQPYLQAIDRLSHYEELTRSAGEWRKLVALTPAEKEARAAARLSMKQFRRQSWEPAVGKGGIFAGLIDDAFTLLPFITTGRDRRFAPVWNNGQVLPPCVAACPSDIPSQQRFQLIRQGRLQQALELVLHYSPFPASVCGEICPNLCMKACSRKLVDRPLDLKGLGRLSTGPGAPLPEPATGRLVAVIGAGPAGLTAAWQLMLKGHAVKVYEAAARPGGRLWKSVEQGKLPQEVLTADLARITASSIDIKLESRVDREQLAAIVRQADGVIICCGAGDKEGTALGFLTSDLHHQNGRIRVNHLGQTGNPKVYAAGEVVSRGLTTHAIGNGRRAGLNLHIQMMNVNYEPETRRVIPYQKLKLDYFDSQRGNDPTPEKEAARCVSCGVCRDCRICESACYAGAISRQDLGNDEFRYTVDAAKCIGCGFCAGVCPCGVWEIRENV
jgi:glutamate synthase domain-containing protein 3/ferredoxin